MAGLYLQGGGDDRSTAVATGTGRASYRVSGGRGSSARSYAIDARYSSAVHGTEQHLRGWHIVGAE